MIVGTIVSIAAVLVIFPLAEHGTVASMDAAIILGFFATGLLFGPMYTCLTELFPREQRQTGMGIAFQTGAVLGGGTAPVIANRIVAGTGNASNVGYYLAAVLVVELVCLTMLPETAPASKCSFPARPRSRRSSKPFVRGWPSTRIRSGSPAVPGASGCSMRSTTPRSSRRSTPCWPGGRRC